MTFNRSFFQSQTVEWPTPAALYKELDREFHFDFDPCPLDGAVDGLAPLFCSWRNKRVWCNPPYGSRQIVRWLDRAAEAALAVYLLPARTDTKWFHDIIVPSAAEIRFVKGRLKFRGATNNAPFPSMVCVFEGEQ